MPAYLGGPFGPLSEQLEILGRTGNTAALKRIVEDLVQRIYNLENGVTGSIGSSSSMVQAAIDNLLKNTDFDNSVLSFTGAGSATDLAFWVRGVTAASTITDATNPKWNKVQGYLECSSVSAANDLSYNFATRIIRPGNTLFLQFLARLKDVGNASGLELTAGIWDKTTGIDDWISGSLAGDSGSTAPLVAKVGPAAATTNYGYKVVGYADGGYVLVSEEGTVVGAGALSSTNYNQITWTAVAGVTQYRIYRTTGPVLGLIAIIESGGASFNDQGVTITVSAPVPAANAPQAKTIVTNFGANLSTEWRLFKTEIKVPRGYNLSQTQSDGQWLRLGFSGLGSMPEVLIDRIGLSFGQGTWSASKDDRTTVQDIVITPVGDDFQPPQDYNNYYSL